MSQSGSCLRSPTSAGLLQNHLHTLTLSFVILRLRNLLRKQKNVEGSGPGSGTHARKFKNLPALGLNCSTHLGNLNWKNLDFVYPRFNQLWSRLENSLRKMGTQKNVAATAPNTSPPPSGSTRRKTSFSWLRSRVEYITRPWGCNPKT